MREEPFKVAAVQAAPVFMDRDATVEKACALIAQAAKGGAKLIVFPEAFIPAYPDWVWVAPPGKKRILDPLYAELLANSLTIPGAETERLSAAARASGAYVAVGVNERNSEASGASIYNSLLYIDSNGTIMGAHRKLVPTGGERLVWARGDGSTLAVYDTPLGRLGGLICWENYMPLARYAMYAWGTQIYIAVTWDHGEVWLSTLRHVAKEGGVWVIGCCSAIRKSDIPERFEYKSLYDADKEWINPGDSAIVSPAGKIVAGPAHGEETILYAEIDPKQMGGSRWILDTAGHYARPDVFELTVDRRPHPFLRTLDPSSTEQGSESPSD
jgi:nitrilase